MSGRLPLAYWVHTPHPFLVQFSESFGIRYYGLAYLLGFLAAGWLLHVYYRAGRSKLDSASILDLMTYLVGGVVIGGRLGSFLLYHPDELFSPPWAFFMIWKGGMASHGGMIGAMVGMALFARKRPITFFEVSDLVVTVAPVGLFFGRVANFINGELWGKTATVPWAIIFDKTGGGELPRHPSQLYEALLEGLLLFAFLQWRFWRSDCIRKQPGRIAGEYLLAYALVRITCELFREPDADVTLILGLSRGTFYSLFMIAGGLALIARGIRTGSAKA